jgi:hypothetical protein
VGLVGRLDGEGLTGLFPWVEKRKKDQRWLGEQRSGETKPEAERRRILLWEDRVSARKPPKERRLR